MPALAYSLSHSRYCQLGRREAQKVETHLISVVPPSADRAKVAQPGKRGLEGETIAAASAQRDLLQHQPPGPNRGSLGRKRRQPGGDLVGVDEARHTRFRGQE